MHYLVLTIIVFVSLVDQLSTDHILPRPLGFVPELLSLVIVLYVVVMGARHRFQYVRGQYWLTFGAIAAVVLCGAIVNNVAPGPLIAGMRYYLRAMPLFLLPAVYEFKETQIRQQLRLLLMFGVLQLPIAIYQRMIVMRGHRFTGDPVFGTLLDSSVLSIYLICSVCVLTGMLLRQRISKIVYFVLFFYLLAATSINETKGTLILLPIGLVATVLIGSPPAKRLRLAVLTVGLFAIFVAGFAVVYDYVQNVRTNHYYTSLGKFFLDEKQLDRYVDTHSGLGATRQAGRVDAIVVPLRVLSRDPAQLAFGFGIGNASHSSLGPQFIGEHYPVFHSFLVSSFSIFLLEIGVLGTALVFLLYWLIYRDALALARTDNSLIGSLAVGWAGIVVLTIFATPYKTIHTFASLSYLFWYFSGLVAAERMRLALGVRSQSMATADAAPIHAPLPAHARGAPFHVNFPTAR
jgi:hypothetical protein